jgi:hypothetical protein
MNFLHFTRRLHLYLGLFLLPWFFMYGVTSVALSHGDWIEKRFYKDGVPNWTTRLERSYTLDVPLTGDLRPAALRIMKDAAIPPGAFEAFLDKDGTLSIYWFSFKDAIQIKYDPARHTLKAEDRRFRWDHILGGMHARGGFDQESALDWAWSILVDIVCAGILIWIASGVYMWWFVRGHRGWGWVALSSGVALYALTLWRL